MLFTPAGHLYVNYVFSSSNTILSISFRCVVLSDPLKDSSRSQESWNAFLTKLRTLLLMSFTKNLGKFEDDMRTLREKRTEPGWSFCEYFMVQVRVSWYWRKYFSDSFVVVGFLVLSIFWSFFEGWDRNYGDWFKSSILDAVCSRFEWHFNIVHAVVQFPAVQKAESLQACQSFMNLSWSKWIASKKCFSSESWIWGKCPITVHTHSNLQLVFHMNAALCSGCYQYLWRWCLEKCLF